jgi:hypothetical protein
MSYRLLSSIVNVIVPSSAIQMTCEIGGVFFTAYSEMQANLANQISCNLGSYRYIAIKGSEILNIVC